MAATTSRTLDLLSLLQSHRHWTARELTDRLDVSERTLRRDIERLRELGYGIESTRGVAGGYRLEAGTGLPPLLLTDDEGVAIAVGLRSQATSGLRGAEHTTLSALAKVEQVLPAALRRRIEALQSHATPAGFRPGAAASAAVEADLLGLLALCCRDSERIRFHYTDASGTASARIVEPYRLVPIHVRWYLLAWDREREDWRTFRVDRIAEVFQTRVRFEPLPLTEADAVARVEASVRRRDRLLRAVVLVDLPYEEFRAQFGSYGRTAEPLDGGRRSAWRIEGESVEHLAVHLLWIPADATWRVDGPPELVAYLDRLAGTLATATSAGSMS
ncbi:WYL domain-containing protein [Agromyces sp. CFH 90414]|uniref:WYL domain-containing protein n=1 Tax=Agromyces agglutinans TaxID=2662258 RepID=A0A6I2FCW1_9MICO|nr:YafY family protein [Agromyces agglutinans]MRG59773.1 WYL domain-containing protein [Agromyces agglutinans]